jgi:hypothetical protein
MHPSLLLSQPLRSLSYMYYSFLNCLGLKAKAVHECSRVAVTLTDLRYSQIKMGLANEMQCLHNLNYTGQKISPTDLQQFIILAALLKNPYEIFQDHRHRTLCT